MARCGTGRLPPLPAIPRRTLKSRLAPGFPLRAAPAFPAMASSGDFMSATVQIGVVMGSSSDWDTMRHAVEILQQLGVPHLSLIHI